MKLLQFIYKWLYIWFIFGIAVFSFQQIAIIGDCTDIGLKFTNSNNLVDSLRFFFKLTNSRDEHLCSRISLTLRHLVDIRKEWSKSKLDSKFAKKSDLLSSILTFATTSPEILEKKLSKKTRANVFGNMFKLLAGLTRTSKKSSSNLIYLLNSNMLMREAILEFENISYPQVDGENLLADIYIHNQLFHCLSNRQNGDEISRSFLKDDERCKLVDKERQLLNESKGYIQRYIELMQFNFHRKPMKMKIIVNLLANEPNDEQHEALWRKLDTKSDDKQIIKNNRRTKPVRKPSRSSVDKKKHSGHQNKNVSRKSKKKSVPEKSSRSDVKKLVNKSNLKKSSTKSDVIKSVKKPDSNEPDKKSKLSKTDKESVSDKNKDDDNQSSIKEIPPKDRFERLFWKLYINNKKDYYSHVLPTIMENNRLPIDDSKDTCSFYISLLQSKDDLEKKRNMELDSLIYKIRNKDYKPQEKEIINFFEVFKKIRPSRDKLYYSLFMCLRRYKFKSKDVGFFVRQAEVEGLWNDIFDSRATRPKQPHGK